MDWSLLPRGLIIGVSVAAPVGPMAILCMRRTLAHGRWAGLVSGFGVATADACYGAVAAFGLTSISDALVSRTGWIRLIGGLFLVYLGVKTMRARPPAEAAARTPLSSRGGLAAFLSTFGLTLTNPATILSFAAIFAGFGVASGERGVASAAALVAGVLVGSMLWWVVLVNGTALLRGWLTAGRLIWINRASGAVIGAFGVLALVSLAT